MVMVMCFVVMSGSGIRGNNRAGDNRKGDQGKKQIAEHFHGRTPLCNPAVHSSGGPGNTSSLYLVDSSF
jgi:hypothetical protein